MTCGIFWTYVRSDAIFYDVWVPGEMSGDSFFNIPADGRWNYARNMFLNDLEASALYNTHKAFQVFSCWNSVMAFTADPF